MVADVSEVLQGAAALGQRLRPNAPLSIEGTIGPHRRWTWARTSLADVKKVRSALGGTVNDVVLAAITHGFRELLLSRGEDLTASWCARWCPCRCARPAITRTTTRCRP